MYCSSFLEGSCNSSPSLPSFNALLKLVPSVTSALARIAFVTRMSTPQMWLPAPIQTKHWSMIQANKKKKETCRRERRDSYVNWPCAFYLLTMVRDQECYVCYGSITMNETRSRLCIGRLHSSLQRADDFSCLSWIFWLHICTGWDEVYESWRLRPD